MNPHFDDLGQRILKWLVDNGIPFDWRDIDGSDDPDFLHYLQQLEKQKLISAVFRISSRLGDQGRVVYARITGITSQGLESVNGSDKVDVLPDTVSNIDSLQQLQNLLAEYLSQPGALRLSDSTVKELRQILGNVTDNQLDAARILNQRLSVIDDATLHDLVVKWIANAVRSNDTMGIAALLTRLANTGSSMQVRR